MGGFLSVVEEVEDPFPVETVDHRNEFKVIRSSDNLSGNKKRIIVISDTHDMHDKLEIPNGDILIHCGDSTKHRSSEAVMNRFNNWLAKLPHKYKIVISGNHDFVFSAHSDSKTIEKNKKRISNATHYLQDELIEIDGIRIYGTPWLPSRGLLKRANNFSVSPEVLNEKLNKIPNNVDILITHCPPTQIELDMAGSITEGSKLIAVHSIGRVKPRVHCFGHNHGYPGVRKLSSKNEEEGEREIHFINAAQPCSMKPIVFDYHY